MIPVFIPPVIIQAPFNEKSQFSVLHLSSITKYETYLIDVYFSILLMHKEECYFIFIPVVRATLRRPRRNALNNFGFIL
jgi:hypothetical protein